MALILSVTACKKHSRNSSKLSIFVSAALSGSSANYEQRESQIGEK